MITPQHQLFDTCYHSNVLRAADVISPRKGWQQQGHISSQEIDFSLLSDELLGPIYHFLGLDGVIWKGWLRLKGLFIFGTFSLWAEQADVCMRHGTKTSVILFHDSGLLPHQWTDQILHSFHFY